MMTETGIFTMSHQVDSTETDMFSRMRLSAFFRLLQKVSVLHCEALGAGRAVTLDRGILWVVTMHHGEFTRMPDYEEKVIIETWPGKTMYSLFPRYYRMTDMGGRELAKVSSIWTHVDMKTREVVPPAESGISIDQVVTGKEVPLPAVPVSIPTESTVIYKVPYSTATTILLKMNSGHPGREELSKPLTPCIRGSSISTMMSEFRQDTRATGIIFQVKRKKECLQYPWFTIRCEC